MVCYSIKVQGRVQGVFFRVSIQREAVSLGLRGFVKNEDDGSVYLEVEGEQEKIDTLIAWIKKGGPPQGSVDEVEIKEEGVIGFIGFKIK